MVRRSRTGRRATKLGAKGARPAKGSGWREETRVTFRPPPAYLKAIIPPYIKGLTLYALPNILLLLQHILARLKGDILRVVPEEIFLFNEQDACIFQLGFEAPRILRGHHKKVGIIVKGDKGEQLVGSTPARPVYDLHLFHVSLFRLCMEQTLYVRALEAFLRHHLEEGATVDEAPVLGTIQDATEDKVPPPHLSDLPVEVDDLQHTLGVSLAACEAEQALIPLDEAVLQQDADGLIEIGPVGHVLHEGVFGAPALGLHQSLKNDGNRRRIKEKSGVAHGLTNQTP